MNEGYSPQNDLFQSLFPSTGDDPFSFRNRHLVPVVQSFSTMQPEHPLIARCLYDGKTKEAIHHSYGSSIRLQDVGPLCDALLGINIFMGSINSRTGFTSKENDFSVLCPVVIFDGKQKFSCRNYFYPAYTVGKSTVRSDAPTLSAESYSVEFSVDMFSIKISLDPETNLIGDANARFLEYMRRKEQVERSIDQTMQEQITQALANCPTTTMVRMRKENPHINQLLLNTDTINAYVYAEIEKQVADFCSWSLQPITIQGALQDAHESLLNGSTTDQLPNFIVTTPEIADMMATSLTHVTEPTDTLYTVAFANDGGEFVPGHIRPYVGVSKKVSLRTKSVYVNGRELPILHVPHLNRESRLTYNIFEHEESFWCFNEVGYVSKMQTKVDDFRLVDKTKILTTDLGLGKDGTFTMDDCLRKGGGLLPETYNRLRYQEMLTADRGLYAFLMEKATEHELIDAIGRDLPPCSPINLFFPSPKVRFVPNGVGQCAFRSTGILGNRASFDNWHPPVGDVEAAMDWMAKRIHLDPSNLGLIFTYLKRSADIMWTTADFNNLTMLNARCSSPAELAGLISKDHRDPEMMGVVQDMILNKGVSKFVCMPRFAEALAAIANKMLQSRELFSMVVGEEMPCEGLLDMLTMRKYVGEIVEFRSALLSCAQKFFALENRVNLPNGLLTDCHPSIPVWNKPEGVSERQVCDAEYQAERDLRCAYRFYLLCIAPLIFRHIYSVVDKGEAVTFVDYNFVNPDKRCPKKFERERFKQPFFPCGILSNVAPDQMTTSDGSGAFRVVDVSAYDPLFRFDLDVLKKDENSRSENFFDHFVSHRFQYLRDLEDAPFGVRATAAFLNMMAYTPQVEALVGHRCLMNRKYRIVRNCILQVGMVGMYRGGKDNMMYALGNLSTVTKMTANNGIEIIQNVNGNCFIIDPLSAGRVIPNAVSKGHISGMTSTIANIPLHVADSGGSRLKNEWWRNMAYVVEGLPGRHPVDDQHHFLPLNGRHVKENLNVDGFNLTKLDVVGPKGGWFAENMYSLRGYSEAHLVHGKLVTSNRLPLYDHTMINYHGLRDMHLHATVERKEMAGKVIEKIDAPTAVFSGQSNIGFLERQLYNVPTPTSIFYGDNWASRSPLKDKSCSDRRFVETLHLTHRRTDRGIKDLDSENRGYDDRSPPYRTGLKGIYTTERTK